MLPLEKCRGQAYDGAFNMSGHIRGVAARQKWEESAALHVHCLAHTTIQEAVEAAKLTMSYLWRLRSDEEYAKFYQDVLQTSQDLYNR